MASSWENIEVDSSNMRAYVSVPDGAQRVPGIIVLQGQSGVDDFLEITRMITVEGYVAVALDLYHRDPADCHDDGPTRLRRLRDTTVIQDIDATVSYLKAHSRVD